MEELELRLNNLEHRIEAIEKWMASQIHSNDQFVNEMNQIKRTLEPLGKRQDPKSTGDPEVNDALGG